MEYAIAQVPGPSGTWIPIAGTEQFLDVSASTALTLPTQAQTAVAIPGNKAGTEIVGILTAQAQSQWVRSDGSAVGAAVTSGLKLNSGDFQIVEGRSALSAVRVIRDAAGGSLNVRYYIYRAAPGARF